MNIIKPLADTQARPIAVEYDKPAPRISWQEEQQRFADAIFQASLEDGAARAFHEAQARSGAVVQSIKAILNGQTETSSVTTVRRTAGMYRIQKGRTTATTTPAGAAAIATGSGVDALRSAAAQDARGRSGCLREVLRRQDPENASVSSLSGSHSKLIRR